MYQQTLKNFETSKRTSMQHTFSAEKCVEWEMGKSFSAIITLKKLDLLIPPSASSSRRLVDRKGGNNIQHRVSLW